MEVFLCLKKAFQWILIDRKERGLAKKAILVLEDGSVYEGHTFGAEVQGYGEVVFNTSMTGYQEVLTDPSYAGQIVVLTYPLVGNYGINPEDIESKRIQVSGFVVREDCDKPSHWQSTGTLSEYLEKAGIPGIGGVDTRAITRRLRSVGVMMGTITSDKTAEEALKWLKKHATLRRHRFRQRREHRIPLPLESLVSERPGEQVSYCCR